LGLKANASRSTHVDDRDGLIDKFQRYMAVSFLDLALDLKKRVVGRCNHVLTSAY
jgi:hypothetical protein